MKLDFTWPFSMDLQSSWVTSGATLVRSTCTLAGLLKGRYSWAHGVNPISVSPHYYVNMYIFLRMSSIIIGNSNNSKPLPNMRRAYLPRKSSPRPRFQSQSSRSKRPSSRCLPDPSSLLELPSSRCVLAGPSLRCCQVRFTASRHSGLRKRY